MIKHDPFLCGSHVFAGLNKIVWFIILLNPSLPSENSFQTKINFADDSFLNLHNNK